MSRLLDSSENERLRNFLESRNLYTPDNPYELNSAEIVDTINVISNVLLPFRSIDIRNTVVGRALGVATGQGTPLAQIGTYMLGVQLANNIASSTSANFVPSTTVDPFNRIFEAFKRKIDFDITRREDQTTFGRFFQNITRSYRPINPFQRNATNAEYVRQTGKGQLQSLVGNLNQNWYVNSDSSFLNALDSKDFAINRYSILNSQRFYFTENLSINSNVDKLFDPYTYIQDGFLSNYEIKELTSRVNDSLDNRSYIESLTFELLRHGDAIKSDFKTINSFSPYGLNNGNENRIIWGRDGVVSQVGSGIRKSFNNNKINRGDSPEEISFNSSGADSLDKFGVRKGLLLYTSELLNATEGKFIDQTRKIFKNPKNGSIVGKQGSGLAIPPSNDYTSAMESYAGVRQHTAIDPYNNFAKAIRFEGNKVYGGHENSVIYDSVIPNIAPITRGRNEQFDPENNPNRNLMFSIENLAFQLDNENTLETEIYDKPIKFPSCQKGPNNGRIMWFAPYDLDVVEQALARYTDTQFLGRGEPVYTYSNSERILTISFKLLVDHPPQSRDRSSDKSVREFFVFGGVEEGEEEFKNLPQLEKKKISLSIKLNNLEGLTPIQPLPSLPNPIQFFFPNNDPLGEGANEITRIIQTGYEIPTSATTTNYTKNYSQNATFQSNLDDAIQNFFTPDLGNLYRIIIIGNTSQLFTSEFNQALSQRRANSIKAYIEEKIKEIHKKTAQEIGLEIIVQPRGEVDDPTTDTTNVDEFNSVVARRVDVVTQFKDQRSRIANPQLNQDEEELVVDLKNQIKDIDTQIRKAKTYEERKNTSCGFKRYERKNRHHLGYESFVRNEPQTNQFQPVFYSQTPKDLHDRLTFLHQCTRQGPAIRKTIETNNGKISVSAKNSVFGRQPICVLRLGDQFHTKVIIENVQISYSNSPWDTNPEGYGMQFMSADITMQLKVIGGQSLYGPISALQNAVTFNYYANSTYAKDASDTGKPAYYFEELQKKADRQEREAEESGRDSLNNESGVVTDDQLQEGNIDKQ
jgi:hypothetical protein